MSDKVPSCVDVSVFVVVVVAVVVVAVVVAVVMVAFGDVVAGMAEQQPHKQVFLQFLISLGAYD